MLVTLSGPAGAGKSTVSRFLRESHGLFELPSYTTRLPRPGEITHFYYRFVTLEEYLTIASAGDFALNDDFANAKYGTKKQDLKAAISDSNTWVADLSSSSVIDAITLGYVPKLALFLYVPLSLSRERMVGRGDTSDKIASRSKTFMAEIENGVKLATICRQIAFIDSTNPLPLVEQAVLGVINGSIEPPVGESNT